MNEWIGIFSLLVQSSHLYNCLNELSQNSAKIMAGQVEDVKDNYVVELPFARTNDYCQHDWDF
jgi:hypothetical protein